MLNQARSLDWIQIKVLLFNSAAKFLYNIYWKGSFSDPGGLIVNKDNPLLTQLFWDCGKTTVQAENMCRKRNDLVLNWKMKVLNCSRRVLVYSLLIFFQISGRRGEAKAPLLPPLTMPQIYIGKEGFKRARKVFAFGFEGMLPVFKTSSFQVCIGL